jgi:hypothetical protein
MKILAYALMTLSAAILVAAMTLMFVQLRAAYMSCGVARTQDLQRAGRERLAIGIWQKRGIPEIGTVWRGMAIDDEEAAAACR